MKLVKLVVVILGFVLPLSPIAAADDSGSAAGVSGVPLPGAAECEGETPAADLDPPDLKDEARGMRDAGAEKFFTGFGQKNRDLVEEGIGEIEAALEIDPRMPDAYSVLAMYYGLALQEPQMAIRKLENGLKHNPKSSTIHMGLGNAYSQAGNPQKAIEYFSAALDLGMPCRDSALLNIGNAYLNLGDMEKAIPYYKEALSANPKAFKARKNLAMAYYHSGNRSAARMEAARLAKEDPDGKYGEWARGALSQLEDD